MFIVKWVSLDGFEYLYQGRELRYQRGALYNKDAVSRKALFSFIDDGGVACSIDSGVVYVMNGQGKTVANYNLTVENS